MSDSEQQGTDRSITSGEEQATGDSALGVTDDDLGNRAQQGDLLGDQELGATEPLGDEHRDAGGSLGGGTPGDESTS